MFNHEQEAPHTTFLRDESHKAPSSHSPRAKWLQVSFRAGWDVSSGSREQLSLTITGTAQSLRVAVPCHPAPRDRPPSSECALGGSAEVARAADSLGE